MSFLPRFLFAEGRAPAYFAKAWLVTVVPSLALALLVSRIVPEAETPFGEAVGISAPIMFALLVVVGPFLETLIMAAVASVLNRFAGPACAAIGSAVLWGLAHSALVSLWGLVVWWPFLILTIVYLTWRPRGFWFAVGMATSIHGLQNAVASAGLFV